MEKCNEILEYLKKYEINNLLCVICNGPPVEACKGYCGCLYCKNCVENRLMKNEKVCPGNSDECKLKNLHVIKDYNIDEPVYIFFQWIFKLNRDNSALMNNAEPEKAIHYLKIAERMIEHLIMESKSKESMKNKENIEKLEKELVDVRQNIENNKISYEKVISENKLKKFDKIFNLPNLLKINDDKETQNLTEIATFVWEVKNILEIRDKNEDIYSDYFNSIDKDYKMWLGLYPKGSETDNDSNLSVRLWMEDGPNSFSRWPFKGYITITMKNKFSNYYKSLSGDLDINISLMSSYGRSNLFSFKYSDLHISEDSTNSSIIIECFISCYK